MLVSAWSDRVVRWWTTKGEAKWPLKSGHDAKILKHRLLKHEGALVGKVVLSKTKLKRKVQRHYALYAILPVR